MPKPKRSLAKSKKTAVPLSALPVASAGLLPSSLLESQAVWSAFLTQYRPNLGMEEDRLEEMMGNSGEYVRNLATRVNQLGGWLEVTGKDAWADAKVDKTRDSRADYENFLFPVLKFLEFQQKYPSPAPYSLSPAQLHPSVLRPIKVFTPPESGLLTQAFWDQVLAEDIAILRGFPSKVWKLDHSLFSFEYLKTHRGAAEIDVLMQDKDPDKDMLRLHSGEKVKSTILDYIEKHVVAGNQSDKVPFAVNVDIGAWGEQIDQFQAKLPEYLLFGSPSDSLSHLRLHINGMSLPQIYLKAAGSWTGAHQENLCFAAINLNHGPGDCQWWGLSPAEVPQVRAEVGAKLGFDTAKSETLWWPDENWVLGQGYASFYGVQRPDDLVYVGPGTLHWVKTTAPAVNSSWNIGPKTLNQFEAAYSRKALNESIGVESLVQLNTLALDLLNSELSSLPIDLVKYLRSRLNEQFEEEKRLLDACKLPALGVFPGHQVRRCESCKREVLYAYAASVQAYCLKCAIALPSPPNCHEMFTSAHFQRLRDRVQRRIEGENVDFYDPGLNLHFTKGMRQRLSQAWVSPYSGFPSCISFSVEDSASDVEMPEASSTPAAGPPDQQSPDGESRKKRPRTGKKALSPCTNKHQKQHQSASSEPPASSAADRRCTRSQVRKEEPEEVEEEQKPVHRGQDGGGKQDSDNCGKTCEKAGKGKGQYSIPKRSKC